MIEPKPERDCDSIEERLYCRGWNDAIATLSQEQTRQPDSEPESPQAEPVAWITTRTKDGKGTTGELPCVSCNPEYVRMHHQWEWQPLYTSPPAAAQGRQPGDSE